MTWFKPLSSLNGDVGRRKRAFGELTTDVSHSDRLLHLPLPKAPPAQQHVVSSQDRLEQSSGYTMLNGAEKKAMYAMFNGNVGHGGDIPLRSHNSSRHERGWASITIDTTRNGGVINFRILQRPFAPLDWHPVSSHRKQTTNAHIAC